jgi:hypothetical protein
MFRRTRRLRPQDFDSWSFFVYIRFQTLDWATGVSKSMIKNLDDTMFKALQDHLKKLHLGEVRAFPLFSRIIHYPLHQRVVFQFQHSAHETDHQHYRHVIELTS